MARKSAGAVLTIAFFVSACTDLAKKQESPVTPPNLQMEGAHLPAAKAYSILIGGSSLIKISSNAIDKPEILKEAGDKTAYYFYDLLEENRQLLIAQSLDEALSRINLLQYKEGSNEISSILGGKAVSQARFSPDGTKVGYVRLNDENKKVLYLADLNDLSKAHPFLSFTDQDVKFFDFVPNMDQVVIALDSLNSVDICSSKLDGKDKHCFLNGLRKRYILADAGEGYELFYPDEEDSEKLCHRSLKDSRISRRRCHEPSRNTVRRLMIGEQKTSLIVLRELLINNAQSLVVFDIKQQKPIFETYPNFNGFASDGGYLSPDQTKLFYVRPQHEDPTLKDALMMVDLTQAEPKPVVLEPSMNRVSLLKVLKNGDFLFSSVNSQRLFEMYLRKADGTQRLLYSYSEWMEDTPFDLSSDEQMLLLNDIEKTKEGQQILKLFLVSLIEEKPAVEVYRGAWDAFDVGPVGARLFELF